MGSCLNAGWPKTGYRPPYILVYWGVLRGSFALLPLLLSLPLLPLLPNCIAGKLISSLQKCYLTFLHLTQTKTQIHRIKQRNAYKYTNTRAVIPKIVQVQYLKGITLSAQTDFLDLTFTPDPDKTERCSYTFYCWILMLQVFGFDAPDLDISECCSSFISFSRMY